MKRTAVFNAIRQSCYDIKYELYQSKSTESIYLTLKYKDKTKKIRFADHWSWKCREENTPWWDLTCNKFTYKDLVKFIRTHIIDLKGSIEGS